MNSRLIQVRQNAGLKPFISLWTSLTLVQKCHLTTRQARVLRSARLVDGSLLDSLNMSKAWLLTENAGGLHDHNRQFLKLSEKSHASVACFMVSQ